MKRHRSTILRELKRNSDGRTYNASKAQDQYDNRRLVCHRKHKLDDPELFALVKDRFLKEHWSPEQIQYRLRHEGSPHSISYATIYRGIYAGRFNDPDRVKSSKQRLRHRGKQRRRKGDPTRETSLSRMSCRSARRRRRHGSALATGRLIPWRAWLAARCC